MDSPELIGVAIDELLRQITSPELMERVAAARMKYGEAVLELTGRAERAYRERFEHEIHVTVFDPEYSREQAEKIAHNDLAFFREALRLELNEAVAREGEQLKNRIRRLIEDWQDEQDDATSLPA